MSSPKHVCLGCRKRPAISMVNGRRKALKDHDLCRQCWRSIQDRTRRTHGR
jgi:hypothetical protein